MSIRPFILSAVASAIIQLAIIPVTTASQLESAVASANSNTVIRIDANITATVPGTLLTLPAGIKIEESAAYTVAGYFWTCQASGNYNTTRIGTVAKRLTIQAANTNVGNTYGGTVGLREGKFVINASVKGLNGGGTKFGNNLYFITGNNNRVEADVYGDYTDSSADLVSIDAGTNPVVATSYLAVWGSQFRRPGSGTTDNWFTNHFNTRSYAIGCDFAEPSASGPGLNSDPDTSTMEIYGGKIDITGANSTNGDLRVTRIIGTEITGTSTRSIFILADANKPTKPSMALRLKSTVPVVLKGTHTVAPVLAEIELTVVDKWVGVEETAPSYVGPQPLIAKIKGSLSTNGKGLVVLNKGGNVYNITTVHTGAASVYPVKANANGLVGSPNTINIYRADINNTSPVTLTYATRSDVQYTTMNINNSKITATNAGFTGGATGSVLNVSGTLLNGTEPSGAATGWLNEGPELAANSTWIAVKSYLNTCPATPGDMTTGYPTDVDSYLP